QLELGDLVAQRIELGEEALKAVAERGYSEDDGSGAGAGHGLGGPDSTELRPAAGRPRSALAWVEVPLLLPRLDLLRAAGIPRRIDSLGHRRGGMSLRHRALRGRCGWRRRGGRRGRTRTRGGLGSLHGTKHRAVLTVRPGPRATMR